jgi:hypothetical protein
VKVEAVEEAPVTEWDAEVFEVVSQDTRVGPSVEIDTTSV